MLELYVHNGDKCEFEGVFSSSTEIDKYMDWPKGTASKIFYEEKPSSRFSILSAGDKEEKEAINE